MSFPTIDKLIPHIPSIDGVHPSVQMGSTVQIGEGDYFEVCSPIDGEMIAAFRHSTREQYEQTAELAAKAFLTMRTIPAPLRGELVRRIGNAFRDNKENLAHLITWEAGKITQESLGEVQEMIDVCDFAVGLSRQLHGFTISSERPNHRMMEQWHPLGPIAVISAFNFPMAVWAWNAMLAFVCGNPVVWKPSDQTPLCALACQSIVQNVLKSMPEIPQDICGVIIGEGGKSLVDDRRFPLVSATGSCVMGREVGSRVGARLGRSLLELGGNNAMIVCPSADMDLAVRAIVFSAVGTTGQRCTSLRRLIVHKSCREEILPALVKAYGSLMIGDPRNAKTLVGPLINNRSYEDMQNAIAVAEEQGGNLITGGNRIAQPETAGGYYVEPAIIAISSKAEIIKKETFAPILYVIDYDDLQDAIEIHNNVPQGLSSAIFTNDVREAELFLSQAGSDCGIANVNIGTSGAEIGGAFGGEKDTGGGRESGSDAWKNYMRRSTNTINYGTELPLAQGISFNDSV